MCISYPFLIFQQKEEASTSGHLKLKYPEIWTNIIPRIASDCKMNMVSTCAFKNLPTQLCDGNKTEDANSI